MSVENGESQVKRERDQALAALWRIRMAAEIATVDEEPWRLPSRIIGLALAGMGRNKREAQELASTGSQEWAELRLAGEDILTLRAAISQAIEDLKAEHQPGIHAKAGRLVGGCDLCWPQDGSWPCVSRMVADDLRQALGDEG